MFASDFQEPQLGTDREIRARKEVTSREFKIERKVTFKHVLMSLGAGLVVLLGLFIFMFNSLGVRASKLAGEAQGVEKNLAKSFPQEGEMISVVDASSLWRHGLPPLSELVSSTRLYPEIDLTFQSMPEAKAGAIRLLLFDHLGNIRGDSLNLDVEKGLIVEGNELINKVFFKGSDGLLDETVVFIQHLDEDAQWYLGVYEGPFKRADFEDFTLVARIPISPQVEGEPN